VKLATVLIRPNHLHCWNNSLLESLQSHRVSLLILMIVMTKTAGHQLQVSLFSTILEKPNKMILILAPLELIAGRVVIDLHLIMSKRALVNGHLQRMGPLKNLITEYM